MSLDSKQKKIITTWLEQSRSLADDPYSSFIALWISFNAYCCAKYAQKACKGRADLRNDHGLREVTVTGEPFSLEGTIRLDGARFELEINQPGRIRIHISEKYTEDRIFSEFAKDYRSEYAKLFDEAAFAISVKEFQSSLDHEGKFYVVNMLKASDYEVNRDYTKLVKDNIIVPLADCKDLRQLKDVLYQVRSNVFHGEKVPGLPNDDRIVKKAYPVLLRIMESLASGFTVQSGRLSTAG